MQTLIMLVKRNSNMYLRNRTSVIFSFLSMVIILVLNTVFLGAVNKDYLARFITLEKEQVAYITGSWLMAGIIIVNVVMVTLATLGIMVEDEEKHKLAAFLVAPINRMTLTLSYIIAACINAFLFSMITIIFSQGYLYLSCGKLLSVIAILKLSGIVLVTIFSMVTFFICIAILVRSTSAFSAITTTVGTLIGFIAGIYLPMGSLSESIQNVLKIFPVLYGTALARQVYTEDALIEAFNILPVEFMEGYKAFMGITIKWGEKEVGMMLGLLILIGSGILFTCIASILLNHKKTSDR